MTARARRGSLHRVHQGVYAVGHPRLSQKGRWMAAVLACGPDAVLSHRPAGALHDLLGAGRFIDVTSPRRAGRSRDGIVAHSAATLMPSDVTVVDGIPCTTVARTLLDLADVVAPRNLRRACEQAGVMRLLDGTHELLARSEGRAGAPALRAAMAAWSPEMAFTRRELEKRFLELCATVGLPRPEANVWIPECAMEVDFLWRTERLVVETDGARFHNTRAAFERDRRRDQRLLLGGYVVARFTWHQIVRERGEAAATLRGLYEAKRR